METGKSKLQKICDVLKQETIEPAKQEAAEIVENAHLQAKQIIKAAEKRAQDLIEKGKQENEKQKTILDSALKIACQQSLDFLRQNIEQTFFTKELQSLIEKSVSDEKVISQMVESVIEGLQKEGVDLDLSAYIAKRSSARKVNELLVDKMKEKLREKEVLLGDFSGGVKVKIHDQKMTIDISAEALKEVVATYIRSDFRNLVFGK